jgi:hypothetical protein
MELNSEPKNKSLPAESYEVRKINKCLIENHPQASQKKMHQAKSVVYDQAQKLLWAGRLNQAEALLKSHIKDDPWAGLAYFQAMLWRVYLLDLPEHDNQAQTRADRLSASVEELASQAQNIHKEIEYTAVSTLFCCTRLFC